MKHVRPFGHLTGDQLYNEHLRYEGVPPMPRAKVLDHDRLQELVKLQAAALDAQRIARHTGDDQAFIAAGRDLGGYEAEMQLMLPDDPKESSTLRGQLHRQVTRERERLRQQDRLKRMSARAATEQPTPRGSGQSQAGA